MSKPDHDSEKPWITSKYSEIRVRDIPGSIRVRKWATSVIVEVDFGLVIIPIEIIPDQAIQIGSDLVSAGEAARYATTISHGVLCQSMGSKSKSAKRGGKT